MQHTIINAMKCMRAIKDRIARPVYQLENHLSQPLYPHGVSTGEIIGTTHQSASHNVAFNQVINQSVNQAQDVSYIETVDILQQKPAVALNKNQQQPTDVAFVKEHQNDAASTNQNDAASLQQLMIDFFPNNQQLVTLNNSNDVVKDTSPLLPKADQKRCTQNVAF
ncbi:hypothetical protein F511_03734 [Dorcoceras hygrometricum]|uniref:Uncharacterized protein n=1 Tax=Dorcoceras hygrometricum TaxID=472368 RepID=A0A2Z7BFL8_9LAMI|nr:hypothetical protein F511_03734 [Dorcoceras hygrometricum]